MVDIFPSICLDEYMSSDSNLLISRLRNLIVPIYSGSGGLPRWLESEVAQSCPTLCDPMDCSLPGFSVLGIFQARVLEWGAIRIWCTSQVV